jgi:single-stranded-DNA-specific exonuclease
VGESAWQSVQTQARSSLDAHAGRFILVHNDAIHRGVTGIIAGRLSRQFDAPAAVVSVLADRAVGSIRTARGMVATDLLAACSDLFLDWGGHDAAAGFHLEPARLGELEERLLELIPKMEMESVTEASVAVDAELPRDFLTPRLQSVVDLFAPFGQENPPLTFLARGLRIDDIAIIGKDQNHVRMLLNSGNYRWPSVFWNGAERVGGAIAKGTSVDVVFNLQTNFFQNKETPQLSLIDLSVSEGAVRQAADRPASEM